MIAHSMDLFTQTLQLAACTLPTNLQIAIASLVLVHVCAELACFLFAGY